LRPSTGPLAGRVFFVTGLALAKVHRERRPGRNSGSPTGGRIHFGRRPAVIRISKAAVIDYAPGDSAAQLVQNARQPLVTATPATVLSGSACASLSADSSNGARVQVSITGTAGFVINVATGAYAWEHSSRRRRKAESSRFAPPAAARPIGLDHDSRRCPDARLTLLLFKAMRRPAAPARSSAPTAARV